MCFINLYNLKQRLSTVSGILKWYFMNKVNFPMSAIQFKVNFYINQNLLAIYQKLLGNMKL